ncbi:HNH endonuclease [Lutibacter sp.]
MELYNFFALKKLVESLFDIDVDHYNSKFEPPPKIRIEISGHELDEKIEISDDGIFYFDENGNKIKGFLYIPIYDPILWKSKGWNDMPRFHITNCDVIMRQRLRRNFDGHYVFSNTAVTDLMDANGIRKDILLCGNCMNKVGLNKKISSTTYVDEYLNNDEYGGNYTEEDLPEEISVDQFGYTPNWDEVSKAYRISKNFTCESCGLKLNENYFDGYFLETHHINGNKTDNNEDNLKCLCTLCHAYVDKNHLNNFKNSKNFKKLKTFVELFYNKLVEIDNPHLYTFLNEFGQNIAPNKTLNRNLPRGA